MQILERRHQLGKQWLLAANKCLLKTICVSCSPVRILMLRIQSSLVISPLASTSRCNPRGRLATKMAPNTGDPVLVGYQTFGLGIAGCIQFRRNGIQLERVR
ncbi:L-hypothetical protein amidase [Diaporthe amygdali]|uniref:L-hypothetical protein amidase n=1 Tax=Phomopsis amygdali TaxID=1214568 RepID=UPI0022FF19A0|nr:L-hypothetical protein amidase [Diaporthe amygdali]KAJ0120966.1 L-hypothetical protein amidase [Diaporthe amygdali]